MSRAFGPSVAFALALTGLLHVPTATAATATVSRTGSSKGSSTAPTAASAPSRGLIMVSDFGGVLRVMDPAAKTIVYDYDFLKEPSESCQLEKVTCGLIGASVANWNDENYFDMAMWVFDTRLTASKIDRYHTVIQRVKPTVPAQVVWKIKDLDFTQVPDGDLYCTQDASNPASHNDTGCRPRLVHSIQVVNDQPDKKIVSVVLADFANGRVEQVTLDYSSGSTLAKVDWVLGDANPEWPDGASPNAVRYYPEFPGGPYLLTTFYSTAAQSHGSAQMMWQWQDGDWRLAWQFPEENSTDIELLNTPHMGEVLTDPATGAPLVIYSHSRGTAGSWDTTSDWGGSYGILRMGATLADKPSYVMDAVVYGSNPDLETKFSRDVDFLSDGSMLLTDAACESGNCPHPSRLFRVAPFFREAPVSSRHGNYAPDEAYIQRYNIPDANVLEEIQCGFKCLFEAEWMVPEKVGKTLRNAAAAPKAACPAPTW